MIRTIVYVLNEEYYGVIKCNYISYFAQFSEGIFNCHTNLIVACADKYLLIKFMFCLFREIFCNFWKSVQIIREVFHFLENG